ncbi:RodZ domain-containing protein [Lentibacillus sp. N15]|uniref:helix-turn-helix domain-containing protein n=1 Tax=Lentibacillus songyuanensis TaxID=3136161 RepID=UPI0031BA8FC0
MEIGKRLREARIQKDLSLDTVQETTKIQKRYLLAIEEENFDILPGKFYARAFIKEYATAVGLDPNELLDEFKEEVPQTEEDSTAQYTRIQRSRRENSTAKSPAFLSFLPTIIVIILVIGIVFVAWYFIKESFSTSSDPVDKTDDNEIIYNADDDQDKNKADDEGKDETKTDEEEADKDKVEDETNEPKLTVVEEGTGASPESTLKLENAGEEIKISFESSGTSYLGVQNNDGNSYFEQEISADNSPQEFDVTDDDRIYLNIGNAPDLKVKINGVELEYPVDPQQYVHQKLWIDLAQDSE